MHISRATSPSRTGTTDRPRQGLRIGSPVRLQYLRPVALLRIERVCRSTCTHTRICLCVDLVSTGGGQPAHILARLSLSTQSNHTCIHLGQHCLHAPASLPMSTSWSFRPSDASSSSVLPTSSPTLSTPSTKDFASDRPCASSICAQRRCCELSAFVVAAAHEDVCVCVCARVHVDLGSTGGGRSANTPARF